MLYVTAHDVCATLQITEPTFRCLRRYTAQGIPTARQVNPNGGRSVKSFEIRHIDQWLKSVCLPHRYTAEHQETLFGLAQPALSGGSF